MSDPNDKNSRLTRRQLVQRGAAATAGLLLAACGGERATEEVPPTQPLAQQQATATPGATAEVVAPTAPPPPTATDAPAPSEPPAPTATDAPAATATPVLEPTPQCDDDDDETPAQTEGPFYTPDTPERTSFLDDGPGTRIVLVGRVLTTDCQPIAGALLDFWHADDAGAYDNDGYRFRGHQFTDESGAYRLETVVPGLYPGRTRHFHVKVQGPTTALLTTQLYFPDEPRNQQDGIFNPALLMAVEPGSDSVAAFDFVLA